jgi:hypothetical protein
MRCRRRRELADIRLVERNLLVPGRPYHYRRSIGFLHPWYTSRSPLVERRREMCCLIADHAEQNRIGPGEEVRVQDGPSLDYF